MSGQQSADFGRRSDGDLARNLRGLLAREVIEQVDLRQDRADALGQPLARGGDADAAPTLFKQFDAQSLFQERNMAADA